MQRWRRTFLTRFVLGWFLLSLGVALASPMWHPQTMELVCSSQGSLKLVVGDADAEARGHKFDCPLCASLGAPPPQAQAPTTQPSPLAYALQPLRVAHIAVVTAPPLPSRGPPLMSS
jgi:hypothetical protein